MTRGLIVAAASSHSGKTTVSLGLVAALTARGLRVAAAKCGPDYIDGKFLEAASGSPAINLDAWAMPQRRLLARLQEHAASADLIIIEGVMGLYDGGPGGAGSTASLARIIGLPMVLVIGTQGMAQSTAAIAEGAARLADDLAIAGAIANQVASERHAMLIREGFERASVPLLGLVWRDPTVTLPSRHLGLVQAEEQAELAAKITRIAELVTAGCDIEEIVRIAAASAAQTHEVSLSPSRQGKRRLRPLGQRLAVARDVAFAFAYPHLLSDWRHHGAELSFFSPLADEPPAENSDAVFLPGGYPELHAERLAAASRFRAGMERAATQGALIYGECGGYMVLGDNLIDANGKTHRMLGLLPLATSFAERKLHLGYRRLQPRLGAPWAEPLSAHEFHFARTVSEGQGERLFTAEDTAGATLGAIGLRRGRIMGSFAHVIDRARS
jgi:cobyrinic acid a,c-diamide synthase